ncbi:MAG: DMT family transporter [Pseudomonadota bacterium]
MEAMKSKQWAFFAMLLATILFALGSPILKLLIIKGGALGIEHVDAISFCNVLFIGNLCAGLITWLSFPKTPMLKEVKSLSSKGKMFAGLSVILAIIYPSLIFFALQYTTVTRIVLLSRFEGIMYAILGAIFLKAVLKKSELVGYIFISIGILIVIFTSKEMFSIADILVLLACVVYAFSELVSYQLLKSLSMPTLLFIRNAVSAVVFFIIATDLFGPQHFAEAFYGDLWIAMLVYAGIAIVLGQILWFSVVKNVNATWPTNFALLTPFFTIAFAYLLLGEVPTYSEWIAIIIIAIGLILTNLINRFSKRASTSLGVETGLLGK